MLSSSCSKALVFLIRDLGEVERKRDRVISGKPKGELH